MATRNVVPASVPADAMRQVSYSGTPRLQGLVFPDDYVDILRDPPQRMAVFEEMRNSDEAVNTAISTREQLLLSSNWLLTTPNGTDANSQILEFCEDNIYPILDDLLKQLCGALQYGFGMLEKVYQWADSPFAANIIRGKLRRPAGQFGRKIYLKKLAHIRQRTIYGFRLDDETYDLTSVLQYVFDGVTFKRIDIPIEKLLLYTHNRMGDDYWGAPPLRYCYRAWTFKQAIERVNLMGFEKFGVGTPVVEESPGGFSDPERARMAAFLKSWRAGETTYIMHPSGGKIDIKTADGTMTMSALEFMKFYNLGIAKTFMTQQSDLGSTDTGSRAVGDTFYEALEGVVQADCEAIASLVNEQLIVPLVDFNFGPQKVYPAFTPSQRVRASREVAQTVTSLVAAGFLNPTPQDEFYWRDVLEMPEIEIDQLQKNADEKKQAEKAANDAQTAALLAKTGKQQQQQDQNGPPTPDTSPTGNSVAARYTAIPDIERDAWVRNTVQPDAVGNYLDVATNELEEIIGRMSRVGDVHAALKMYGDQVSRFASKSVSDELDRQTPARWERNVLLTAGAHTNPMTDDEPYLATLARLADEEVVDGRTPEHSRYTAAAAVHAAYAYGLELGARANARRIGTKVYTAILDKNSCAECAQWDGAEFDARATARTIGLRAPNPLCYGRARCRCRWVYVRGVPADNGPARDPARARELDREARKTKGGPVGE